VPPTGAKGLNLAVSDVVYLSRALIALFAKNDPGLLNRYGADALARIWQATRFSWSMTMMMHHFPDHDAFDRQMQATELATLASSPAAQKVFAENYTGPPF
jgi:p-hydroxybenzoate 3-monooxygenase